MVAYYITLAILSLRISWYDSVRCIVVLTKRQFKRMGDKYVVKISGTYTPSFFLKHLRFGPSDLGLSVLHHDKSHKLGYGRYRGGTPYTQAPGSPAQ